MEFRKLAASLKGHTDINEIELEAEAVRAEKAQAHLVALRVAVAGAAKPFNIAEWHEKTKLATSDKQAAHAEVLSSIGAMKKMGKKVDEELEAGKAAWFRDRDLAQGKYKAGTMPRCSAKLFVDGWMTLQESPSRYGLNFQVNAMVASAEPVGDDFWEACRHIPKFEEGMTGVPQRVGQWFRENQEQLKSAAKSNINKAKETGRKATLGWLDKPCMPFVDGDGIAPEPGVHVSVYTIGDLYVDCRRCAWPFGAPRSMITAVDGTWLVITVPPKVHVAHTDLADWLGRVDSAALGECQTWHISPGESIYIACGWVPLLCQYVHGDITKQQRGPPQGGKKAKATKYGTIATTLFLDLKSDPQHDQSLNASMMSIWSANQPFMSPQIVEASASWKAAMEKPKDKACLVDEGNLRGVVDDAAGAEQQPAQ